VAFLEVKRNKSDTAWHPHLHLIVTGQFIPQKILSQVWKATTKDSDIVDVRVVPQNNRIAHYVTKYLTKPVDQSVIRNHESLVEAISTLAGRRSIITFGDWKSVRFKTRIDSREYVIVARLDTLLRAALANEASALAIYAQLRHLPHVHKQVLDFSDSS